MRCAHRSLVIEMEAALAKATLRTHVTLGIVMIGEKHGALAMEHAAAVFAKLWDEEDKQSVQTDKNKNEK